MGFSHFARMSTPTKRVRVVLASGDKAGKSSGSTKARQGKSDRYIKGALLGQGTFGIVYAAEDADDEERRLVAVKKIRKGKFSDGIHWTALREIKILREVSHPNIVNLLDVFESEDHVFLVFEYCEFDLEAVIKDGSILLTEAHVKSYMKMLLAGVANLHKSWVLHRDLKPSNLLMNEKGILKIGDFGLARIFANPPVVDPIPADDELIDDEEEDDEEERGKERLRVLQEYGEPMSSQVVTIWYRPPELLLGAKYYGGAVDVWSVGCIFAELLARVPLFPGQNDLDQLGKIFRILGTPTPESWPGMTSLPSFMNFQPVPSIPLETLFPAASGAALELLKATLLFDPAARPSAKEALEMDFFSSGVKFTPCESLPKPTRPAKIAPLDSRVEDDSDDDDL